mmetsp:Transcript_13004/g.28699  ORF Transcript_13004/g.28699 Transcript_13004/m.28699 type:complete len:99 (-) Transcript_13004:331-627(-)
MAGSFITRSLNLCSKNKALADSNVTPDKLALAVVLVQPLQPHVLSGVSRGDHLKSNFRFQELTQRYLRENPPDLKQLMEDFKMKSVEYWKGRSALSWN